MVSRVETGEYTGVTLRHWIQCALGLLVGGMAAMGVLVSQEVKVVQTEVPLEKREMRMVYYIEGSAAGGERWKTVRQSLELSDAQAVEVVEGAINQWLGASLPVAGPDAAARMVELQRPTVRIVGEQVQVGGLLSVNIAGFGGQVYVQARGPLGLEGEGIAYAVTDGYLGRAPIGKLPGGGLLLKRLLAMGLGGVEDAGLAAALGRWQAVTVAEGALRFTR